MEMRKKEEREALHSEKGRIEKKNELNYRNQRIEKEPIHTKREIERR